VTDPTPPTGAHDGAGAAPHVPRPGDHIDALARLLCWRKHRRRTPCWRCGLDTAAQASDRRRRP
jgi:hypothetical protein